MASGISIAVKYTGNAQLVATSGEGSPMGKLMQRAEKWGPKFKKKLMPELGAFTVRMLRQVAPIALYYNDDGGRQPGTLKDGIDYIVSTLGIAINSVAIDPFTKIDYAPVMEHGGQSILGTKYGRYPGLFEAQPYFYDTIEDIARQFVIKMPNMYKEYMQTGKVKKLSKYLNQSQILSKIKARNARHKENRENREYRDEVDDVRENERGRTYDPYDESQRGLSRPGGSEFYDADGGGGSGEQLRVHTISNRDRDKYKPEPLVYKKPKRVTIPEKRRKVRARKKAIKFKQDLKAGKFKPTETFRQEASRRSAVGRNKRIQQTKRLAGGRPTWNRGNESSSQFQKRLAAYYKNR